MVPLHQGLELRFDIGAAGVVFKAERFERAALGIEYLARLGRGFRLRGAAGAGLAEQRKRVVGRKIGAAEALRHAPGALAADRAHLPGWPVAGQRILLVFRDRVVAHAGEKIVRTVVFADMFEAEPPIFSGAFTALRGAMRCRRVASGPVAAGKLRAQAAILVRLHPDSIEQRRVVTHRHDYAGASTKPSRLDRR